MEHTKANQGWPVTFHRQQRLWRACLVRATGKSPTAESLDRGETARCVPKLHLMFNAFMHECLTFEFPKQWFQQMQSTDLNPNSAVLQIFPVCYYVTLKVSPIPEIYNMHCQESLTFLSDIGRYPKYIHIKTCSNLTIPCELLCPTDMIMIWIQPLWFDHCGDYRRQAFHLICESCHLLLIIPLENICECDQQSGRN